MSGFTTNLKAEIRAAQMKWFLAGVEQAAVWLDQRAQVCRNAGEGREALETELCAAAIREMAVEAQEDAA